jgi:hypothetical protein
MLEERGCATILARDKTRNTIWRTSSNEKGQMEVGSNVTGVIRALTEPK